MQFNLVYKWVDFSKFSKNWLQFTILWFGVILLKIWPKIVPIGIWMGYFFLKNCYLYFVWVYFQIPRCDIPTKTKLEYPPPINEIDLHLQRLEVMGLFQGVCKFGFWFVGMATLEI